MLKRLIFLGLPLFISLSSHPLNAFTPPSPGESFVYPNPTNTGTAHLAFYMAEPGNAHLLVYNENGSLVMDLRGTFPAGTQQFDLFNTLLADGAYIYRLSLAYDSGDSEGSSGKFAVIH